MSLTEWGPKATEIINTIRSIQYGAPLRDQESAEAAIRTVLPSVYGNLPLRWVDGPGHLKQIFSKMSNSPTMRGAKASLLCITEGAIRCAQVEAAMFQFLDGKRPPGGECRDSLTQISVTLLTAKDAALRAAFDLPFKNYETNVVKTAEFEQTCWMKARERAAREPRNEAWQPWFYAMEGIAEIWRPFHEALRCGLWSLAVTSTEIFAIPSPIAFFDDSNRLHKENGPAIIWQDETVEWFWHGIKVSEKVVLRPEEITVEEIKETKNVELRRTLRERMGDGVWLVKTGSTLIDADARKVSSKEPGGVPRALLLDSEGQKWFVGTDHSTKRVYYMRAPAAAKTCREAHEAISGFDETKIVSQS